MGLLNDFNFLMIRIICKKLVLLNNYRNYLKKSFRYFNLTNFIPLNSYTKVIVAFGMPGKHTYNKKQGISQKAFCEATLK